MLSDLPLWWANTITMAMFVIIAALVWRVPLHQINHDARDRAKWRDIRWWALVLIAIQLVTYTIFR